MRLQSLQLIYPNLRNKVTDSCFPSVSPSRFSAREESDYEMAPTTDSSQGTYLGHVYFPVTFISDEVDYISNSV